MFQGKGEEHLLATLLPCGLGAALGSLLGLIEGLREGFGDSDRVRPRLEDLENARFTDLVVSLTFFNEAVSVSSHGLLRLS